MAPSRFSHKKLFDEGGKGVGLGFRVLFVF